MSIRDLFVVKQPITEDFRDTSLFIGTYCYIFSLSFLCFLSCVANISNCVQDRFLALRSLEYHFVSPCFHPGQYLLISPLQAPTLCFMTGLLCHTVSNFTSCPASKSSDI